MSPPPAATPAPAQPPPALGEHTILFTVSTRAVTLNPDQLPVSVFVSPRLTDGDRLAAFPDWLHWTRNVQRHGLNIELSTGARTIVAPIDTTPLRPDLWKELFRRTTLVEPYTFDDYGGRGVLSYSVNDCLSALKAVYQDASVSLALPDPPRDGDAEQEDGRPHSPNRDHLRGLVDGLQVNWDGDLAARLRAATRIRHDRASRLLRSSRPVDGEGLAVFAEPPTTGELQRAAVPFAVFHHMPSPPERDQLVVDPATLFDFHKALSALNSYPRLLRALGLVFDLDLPRDFVAETSFAQVSRIWVSGATLGADWSRPPTVRSLPTAVVHAALDQDHRLFVTAPRAVEAGSTAPLILGLVDLTAGFGFAQLDVDGGMHKAIMAAETLHPSGDHNLVPDAGPQAAPNPEVFDPEATLPALRSGGMTLYADRAGLALLDAIAASGRFDDAVTTGKDVTLYADDLVRGYRLDVWDSLTGLWHSLHLRTARYRVGKVDLDAAPTVEEGYVEPAVTQPAPGAAPKTDDLYVHEALARWRGWSLSAPLPFLHLSRYAGAEDALPKPGDPAHKFDEDLPTTPFHVTSPHKVVGGSLPALRFGVRYRMRARVVDLAGNSLAPDDPFADRLAPWLALPRDAEGFAYLRFEPVVAPLVVIRDPAVVQEPGSAVHRLVLRTYNAGIEQDDIAADVTLGDRHVVPPRTSVEQGEQMGMFDQPFGTLKGDATTWALIADRDAGALPVETIAIAGGDPQDYPVVPAGSVDALPYLPDPLSRAAAIRDLPGTASGTVGRADPAAGGPGSVAVAYTALSDPNPRKGSATIVGFGGPGWEDRQGFRLALAEPAPGQVEVGPRWDPAARSLTVYLPKGAVATVPLSSWVDPHDLKLLGVWQWLREYVDRVVGSPDRAELRPAEDVDRIAHVLQRAVEGGHWMLTPPTLLTLLHAVQQPIGRPTFTALNVEHPHPAEPFDLQTAPARGPVDPGQLAPVTAWRRLGSTSASLLGALRVHGLSTGRVDLAAAWEDPVDLPPAAPATQAHAGTTDALLLRRLGNGYVAADGAGHRRVGYYDPEHDQIAFVRSGDRSRPEEGDPTYFSEAAPRHELGDTKRHVVTYTPTATSRFQEHFPGLDVTRPGLPVVVDVPASARPLAPDVVSVLPTFGWQRQADTNLKRSVRFGGGLRIYLRRPWFSSGVGELLGVALYDQDSGVPDEVARVKLKPYITQWGMDPIWETAGLSGFPYVSAFPDAVDADYSVTLEEDAAHSAAGLPGRVHVVGFPVDYDPVRDLWFADLTVDLPGDTYMPFVRLALVRYQPKALPDALISRVVLADFMQLTPDRTATVTGDPYHPRTLRVAVSGVAPRGPRAMIGNDVPGPPRPTQVTVRVQRRDPRFRSDVGWHDVGPDVARVTVEHDGPAPAGADLELWRGTVSFATAPSAGAFRLLVEEHEYVSAPFADIVADRPRPPSRVIFAETFAVDELLTGG